MNRKRRDFCFWATNSLVVPAVVAAIVAALVTLIALGVRQL